ncbi:hypothetical protein ACFO6R_06420 [Eubacterium multiforme]|uniref:Uncharacterized protein n=1 Tax=Eubacterium multiforme TaxID=83339 RepID=A0ABT9USD8_9FIRM|nr:hypothetical protein [Eubacterium multiforme]MDQ0149227.1 hypothetical protein [Eubacterium multiforme]
MIKIKINNGDIFDFEGDFSYLKSKLFEDIKNSFGQKIGSKLSSDFIKINKGKYLKVGSISSIDVINV